MAKAPTPQTNNPRISPAPKAKGPLAALVGTSAAVALFTMIPKDESGRTVEVTVEEDGTIVTEHVSGPQYLKAYVDMVGVVTICDGDTYNVRRGQVATEKECRQRLERQLVNHARPVLRCVPGLSHPARENELVASVSLAYNIGTGGFCRSTVARRFNAGNWEGGCRAMMMWNKGRVNGRLRPIRGLTLRRKRERDLCLKAEHS